MKSSSRQLRFLSVAKSALNPGEIGVDLFAGGGGWSEGFQWATGVPPAVAVNHDEDAIVMHTANHPETEHHHEDVFEVDPVKATRGRAVGWLHLSPDCTHFSRAKGGKPRSQKIRALATVALPWARAVAPRIISLENVAEFVTWGPLDESGTPIKERAGETFREWVADLESLGYVVEWRVLNAADYGAPTSRKRLFVIARRDGLPIVWPTPTHGKGRKPYRTAAECIDWSIPCPSIFDRKKPLADATLRRIAEGVKRYVLNNPRPFVVTLTHGARVESIDEPFKTVTAAHRGEKALITPLITKTHSNGWDKEASGVTPGDRPFGTILPKDGLSVIAPTLIQAGYGERPGQKPRVLDIQKPLGTIVSQGNKHALVAAMLKHYGGVVGQEMEKPLGTITAKDHHAVVAAHVTKFYGTSRSGTAIDSPLGSVTAGAGGGHFGLVSAFLTKFYSEGGQWQRVNEPLHTIPTVDRFGLVTVTIDGEEFFIADIGMRMLQPRELARAQGFPDSYVLTGTKTQQVARIGNSVVPFVAAAIVRANLSSREAEKVAA